MAKATTMSYSPTFHEAKTSIGTTLTALGASYASRPRLVVVSAVADFYMNYGSDSNTTRFFVESSGQPFKIMVDDMAELYFAAVSGTVNIFLHSYPPNTVHP
jgi:hypothetical protein